MATAAREMIAEKPAPVNPARLDVSVVSIGTASLRTAAAIAQGLGVPLELAVQAIYRAPATLVRDVEASLAQRLCAVLSEAGLVVATAPAGTPAEPTPLYDVAAHFTDPLAVHETAAVLHRLTGIGEAAALAMLLTPPGVVLGSVSAATIDALRAALPPGVTLAASVPGDAEYQLLLGDSAAIVERGIIDELAAHAITPLAPRGIVAANVDHATAQKIWQRFSRTGALQMVNQDFLRFAVVVDAPPRWTPEQADALARRAGIPPEALATLAGFGPITVEDGLALADAATGLADYAAIGLVARAELTTFRHYRLEISNATDRAALAAQMAAQGLAAPTRLPWLTGESLPDTRARLVRALLEAVGAEVYLVDPTDG
jgi:hypothetical protein